MSVPISGLPPAACGVKVAPSGDVLALYGNGSYLRTKYRPAGGAWGNEQSFPDDGQCQHRTEPDRGLDVDASGRFALLWYAGDSTSDTLGAIRGPGQAGAWASTVIVPGDQPNAQSSSLAADDAGNVVIGIDLGGGEIALPRYSASSQTWNTSARFGPTPGSPCGSQRVAADRDSGEFIVTMADRQRRAAERALRGRRRRTGGRLRAAHAAHPPRRPVRGRQHHRRVRRHLGDRVRAVRRRAPLRPRQAAGRRAGHGGAHPDADADARPGRPLAFRRRHAGRNDAGRRCHAGTGAPDDRGAAEVRDARQAAVGQTLPQAQDVAPHPLPPASRTARRRRGRHRQRQALQGGPRREARQTARSAQADAARHRHAPTWPTAGRSSASGPTAAARAGRADAGSRLTMWPATTPRCSSSPGARCGSPARTRSCSPSAARPSSTS